MTASLISGPFITAGNMLDSSPIGTAQNTDPVSGPNIFYHGQSFPDVRYFPLPKDNLDYLGAVYTNYDPSTAVAINAIPSTAGVAGGSANVASPQPAINGTAFTLATASSVGISINVPYQNFATKAITNGSVLLDLGIESPAVTSGSKTVTVINSSIYRNGQPIIITNVGNAAGTTHLFTYITGLPTATTITIADSPLASNSTTTRICGGLPGWYNLNGGIGGVAARPLFYAPYIAGGVGLIFDETQAIERGVAITGTVAATGGAFTIKGADIYGQTQSEVVTLISGASTAKSVKCYKVINSVTPSFVDSTHTYSVVTQDLYGLPFRSDFWEYLAVFFGGNAVSSSTGWKAGDQTSPATTSTGDPRGTYALQTAAQGASRLLILQTLPFNNVGRATPNTPQFLYGVTPV
jgi:hypothetical protein